MNYRSNYTEKAISMSYLDDPRVLFAAERTLLAWQRTAIALIALGFVIERFGLVVQLFSRQPIGGGQHEMSMWVGVGMLIVAALISTVSAIQFRRFLQTLSGREIPAGYWPYFGFWINLALSMLALLLAGYFISSTAT
jgi:putative membrane protein